MSNRCPNCEKFVSLELQEKVWWISKPYLTAVAGPGVELATMRAECTPAVELIAELSGVLVGGTN